MPQVTVGVVPAEFAPANYDRKTITIRNNSAAAQIAYLDNAGPGGLTPTNCGYILAVGEWYSFSTLIDGKDIKRPWSAVGSAAGTVLVFKEMSED